MNEVTTTAPTAAQRWTWSKMVAILSMFCIVVIVCSVYVLNLYGAVSNILFGASMIVLLLEAIAASYLFMRWIKDYKGEV